MRQLVEFLYKFRAFFLFVVLQVICAWMIIANNDYQRSVYFNTSNRFAGSITEASDNVSDYFSLGRVNRELAEENARLKQLLLNHEHNLSDTLANRLIETDSTDSLQYILRAAEVVDNSIRKTNNFFMINIGARDSIAPGMGVINQYGIVGKIRSVTNRYAQAISLLNTNNPISSKLKRTNRMGTILWDGLDPTKAQLLYIPRDVDVQVGDTVVTSSYNSVFPKDLIVGVVSKSEPDTNNRDLDIEVDLIVDFGTLSFVYVIENRLKPQKDSLIQNNPLEFNE